MTDDRSFERRMVTWLEEEAAGSLPDRVLESVFAETRVTRRPAWPFAGRLPHGAGIRRDPHGGRHQRDRPHGRGGTPRAARRPRWRSTPVERSTGEQRASALDFGFRPPRASGTDPRVQRRWDRVRVRLPLDRRSERRAADRSGDERLHMDCDDWTHRRVGRQHRGLCRHQRGEAADRPELEPGHPDQSPRACPRSGACGTWT